MAYQWTNHYQLRSAQSNKHTHTHTHKKTRSNHMYSLTWAWLSRWRNNGDLAARGALKLKSKFQRHGYMWPHSWLRCLWGVWIWSASDRFIASHTLTLQWKEEINSITTWLSDTCLEVLHPLSLPPPTHTCTKTSWEPNPGGWYHFKARDSWHFLTISAQILWNWAKRVREDQMQTD